jgi:hypothetical protein
MPNLPAHIQLAQQAATRLEHPVLMAHEGAFLLGATTPDIRAMAKWPREQTHFAPLSVEEIGAGAQAMFQANPHLRETGSPNGPTRAFISGYINHLVADETWIVTVYRQFFGGGDTPEGKVLGNMWDRAMQLDMDREAKADEQKVQRVTELLEGAEAGVDIGFVEAETLAEWRLWVQRFNSWEFSWERLSRALRRMYGDDEEALAMAQEFIDNMPQSLEKVYEMVTPQRIASYREEAVTTSMELIEEYLDASAGN